MPFKISNIKYIIQQIAARVMPHYICGHTHTACTSVRFCEHALQFTLRVYCTYSQ